MSEVRCNPDSCNICDLEYLLVNLGRNRATADRLCQLFLDNAPVLCGRLAKAAAEADLNSLKVVLHDIRSSCVLFSGHRCVDGAREVESLVREQILLELPNRPTVDWCEKTVSLINCVQCMAEELQSYLTNGSS